MSLLAQVPASECGKYTTCRRVMISGFYCTMSSGQPLLSRSSLAREEGKVCVNKERDLAEGRSLWMQLVLFWVQNH